MGLASGLMLAGFAAFFSSLTQAAFTATTANAGSALTAADLDAWIPTAVTTTRTGPTTCQVTWTPTTGLRPGITYDITDGTTTLASTQPGTTSTVTVATTALTPHVHARFGTWTSAASAAAASACTGYPDPPEITATPTDTQITATWTTPADNGSAITGYTATTTPATQTCTLTPTDPLTCTFTALTNGTTYTVTVTATNTNGTT
ncbi:MAG: fibronectin type III domain-containing protein, partial [Kineosporiaceae bacterium]|nr:fibronectin type III domain-containing protein [Kineosporiaceae bacterium]